ncbi:MAG: enoyl-CoA hydratase-related protein [Flavisolibacter sp.]
MYKTLLTTLEKGVLTVVINRPDKLNALNKELMGELETLLHEIEKDHQIRAAVITGSGPKSFIAGADISEFNTLTKEESFKLSQWGQEIFFKIEFNSKPIIAAVNGFALGGGCELAMACHFRIASDNASFGQPEVNLGLIPGYGGTQRLVQLIGKGRALELMLTGNMIDAATALAYGLVNHVVKPEELMKKAISLAEGIVSKSPLSLSQCILSANGSVSMKEGYILESKGFSNCFDSKDGKEGIRAFLEKRKPVFFGH